MRITRKSDEDATTKRNPLRAMHLKKVKSLKTGLFTFLYKENPALDAGFRERYAFDQKSSKS